MVTPFHSRAIGVILLDGRGTFHFRTSAEGSASNWGTNLGLVVKAFLGTSQAPTVAIVLKRAELNKACKLTVGRGANGSPRPPAASFHSSVLSAHNWRGLILDNYTDWLTLWSNENVASGAINCR